MQQILRGAGVFALAILPVVAVVLTARKFLKIPDELFRKILHFVLLGGYFVFLYGFATWWAAVAFVLLLMLVAYPLLMLFGRLPAFSAYVNERKKGEFKSSLVLAMLVAACSITVCWGLLDDKLLTMACVYAWGVGDGFAALVGKRFGKHKIKLPFADSRKSWEGSAAMLASSTAAVTAVLLARGGLGFGSCFAVAMAAAAVCTVVELCTKGGWDTVTCPAAALAVILPLIHLLEK